MQTLRLPLQFHVVGRYDGYLIAEAEQEADLA
jgi:hypothetical protein